MSDALAPFSDATLVAYVIHTRPKCAKQLNANLQLRFAREALLDAEAQLEEFENALSACDDEDERFRLAHRAWKARALVDVRALVVKEVMCAHAKNLDERFAA